MKRVLLGLVFASQVHSMNIETVNDAVVRLDTMIQSMETSLLSGAMQELNDQIGDLESISIANVPTEGCSDCADSLMSFKAHLCSLLRCFMGNYCKFFSDNVSMCYAFILLSYLLEEGLDDNDFVRVLESYNRYDVVVEGKTMVDRLNDWTEKQFGERMFTVEWLHRYADNPNKTKIISDREIQLYHMFRSDD